MTTVFVENLQFHAYHGISSEEQRLGHRFRLDIFASVEETASDSDQISETVDYAALAWVAVDACLKAPRSTVERAAKIMGDKLLTDFPAIQSVRLRLAKIQPAIDLSVEAVGVEMTIDRI